MVSPEVRLDGSAGSGSEREPDLELVRVAVHPSGAFGVLLIDGRPCGPVTLERTYPVDPIKPLGAQYVKIPAGRYRCVRTMYHKGGHESFEVLGVVGHSDLKFHRLNEEMESDGCIGVGMRFSALGPKIEDSRRGFDVFMSLMHGRQSFDLLVKDPA